MLNEKIMTVEEIADILKIQPQGVRHRIRNILPEKMSNGKKTKITKEEFETIKNYCSIKREPKFVKNKKRNKIIENEIRRSVIKRDGKICQYCGIYIEDAITIDHIIPFSKKGTDDLNNLLVCCKKCNSMKRDSDLKDFRETLFLNKHDMRIHYIQYNHLLTKGIDLLKGIDKSFYYERKNVAKRNK